MTDAYAFDAYGTLFDVGAAVRRHAHLVGPEAEPIAALWRLKQLEYSWVGTLMGRYEDFWTLTERALDFVRARYPHIDDAARRSLLEAYWELDAYPDVVPALTRLKGRGARVAVFTNGTAAMAIAAVDSAGVGALVDDVVSVDDVRRFKTAPEAYALLCDRLQAPKEAITLVSSNRWDVAGGVAFGLGAIWCNRTGAPDEYAAFQPGRVTRGLEEL